MARLFAHSSFNFIRTRWITFALSIGLVVASLGLVMVKGLNFGIDFTGGIVLEVRIPDAPSIESLRSTLSSKVQGNLLIQHIGENEEDFFIKIQHDANDTSHSDTVQALKDLLLQDVSSELIFRKVDFVGPKVSGELLTSGAMALGFAFLAILIYIWFRFELQFGVGAIIALVHDVCVTIGFISLYAIEFNLASIAAVLTIVGYSINDSVVIYDRIRENLRKYNSRPLSEILNMSLNQTLSRTLLTAGSTIVALIALVVFGGDVIQGFSLTILFGVVIGTYSSVYVAAPILLYLNIHPDHGDNTKRAS